MTVPYAPDWLARRAQLTGSDPALINAETGRVTTYTHWNARVNQTARWLQGLGVGAGARVALLAGNSETWLDVWFACGKLGAILQALNWRLPALSLKRLIDHAQPRLLLVDRSHASVGEAAANDTPTRQLAALEGERAGLSEGVLDGHRPTLEDPWVLCPTGGTTGLPKLAVLTHGNILWNAAGTAASWQLHAKSRALLNAPLFHTGGMNVFTAPLVWAGGASVVCDGFDAGQVLDHVARGAITCFFGVPTMFQVIQRHPRFASTDFSRLELVISGGAPCPSPVFDAFWDRGLDFKTGYGLTEAGPNNFWLPHDQVREKPGAVGYPLLHVEARLLNEQGADSSEGELLLRGPHVVPGYYQDPEATGEAIDEEGWLHTGDLARRDSEGSYTIFGRKKDMYISGGENVYPAEVESVLSAHPSVVEVAVVGRPDDKWGEVGHAFVVGMPSLSEEIIRSWIEGRLAKYQQPARYTFLDALPRTGAGKIDVGRLRDGL